MGVVEGLMLLAAAAFMAPEPRVGMGGLPFICQPPAVLAGHAGAEKEGLYAALATPEGEIDFH